MLLTWGECITLGMIACALGMDALSLGVALGIRQPSLKRITFLSGMVGLFHMLMPFLGISAGYWLSGLMKEMASLIGGALLLLLGINMLIHSFKTEEARVTFNENSLLGMVFFALSVSLDSLSAGLGLGFFRVHLWLAIVLFGVISALMTVIGLMIGKYVSRQTGFYGEALGGMILITLGAKFLW